jgi:hypothetical protein
MEIFDILYSLTLDYVKFLAFVAVTFKVLHIRRIRQRRKDMSGWSEKIKQTHEKFFDKD